MKNNNSKIDVLLRLALSSTETPSPELIQQTKLKFIKEESIVKKSRIKRSFSTIAAAALLCVLIPAAALAAWHFLSPSQVAKDLEYPVLAEAFRGSDALLVNETKSDNGFDVSFLGIVSGNHLTELDKTVNTAKTYAVVAIKNQKGSMPAASSLDFDGTPFFVSPLIKGQNPWQYNIASMGGGYENYVVDGIMYRLIECDSIEMFADRGLSLIVSSTDFYSTEAFNYDEKSGLVSPNPDFDGVNLLFDLPLDTSNADYEKAQDYLDTLWAENSDEAEQSTAVDTGDTSPEILITDDDIYTK